MEAPFLTVPEVRQEVERIFRRDHRSQLVALFGRGEPSDFDLGGQRWNIIPTRCELQLREQLPRPSEKPRSANVYLIDWAADVLPLDVACRLAGGRLYHVARDARLAALFGARYVEPGLAGSALAKLFLSGKIPQPRKVQGLQLTQAAAWTSLLESRFRLPESAMASIGALLAWASSHEGGPAFVRQAEGDDLWRNVRRELVEWIRGSLGDAGAVVWQAWEAGAAGRVLEVLPLLGAAREGGDSYLAGQLAGQLSAWLPNVAGAVRSVETALVDDKVLGAALPAERAALLSTLDKSQALAEGAGLGNLTNASPRLPGGHQARERELAAVTEGFVEKPTAEHAAAVVEALTRLEEHTLDEHLRPEDHRTARRNLGRMALWLASRGAEAPAGTRWQPAVDLARRYAEEGGYVEWSRQQLRGLRGADESLLAAARRLELVAAEALRADHRAFAEAYVGWVDAHKPSASAIPIEDLGKQVIVPFLNGDERRKLLVVLMDGMSHGAAVQLLTRLGSARRWGPIAWRRDNWHGVLPLPPILAAAPTLTEISRGAFFAGKADPRFGDEGTDKDPARWKAHRAVADVIGDEAPPLFLRRDILSGHDLANDIRDAIKGDCRAVAVVVNAIDEDLSGSVQVAKDYSLAPVLPLDALLSAAEEGERAVLLVADHGHILGDGTRTLEGRLGRGRPSGARWRALGEDEKPEAGEVVLPKGSWVPRRWDRVAALWDPFVVNRAAKYGEHGGLSLAEAVAPAVLIAPDWLERAIPDDPGLTVRPVEHYLPRWWELDQQPRSEPAVAPAVPKAPQAKQLTLLPEVAQPPRKPTTIPPPSGNPLVDALRKSAVFKAQTEGHKQSDVEKVLEWLTIIAEASDAMSDREFARRCQTLPHRVAGLVARMGMLNCDGYAMVEHDRGAQQVVLKRTLLVQQYGLKL